MVTEKQQQPEIYARVLLAFVSMVSFPVNGALIKLYEPDVRRSVPLVCHLGAHTPLRDRKSLFWCGCKARACASR